MIVPYLVIGIGAFGLGGPAKEVQAIAVTNSKLQAERDHIIDVWLHRLLPDW